MILIQQLKLKIPHTREQIREKAAKALGIAPKEILEFEILRRSLDARKKPELFYLYSAEVKTAREEKVLKQALSNKKAKEQFSISDRQKYCFPERMDFSGRLSEEERPVIVGAGPAGLFCALYLARAGLRPLLLERGKPVEDRTKDVEAFWRDGRLMPNSNVQFGEGGAGTFSDGKLNTLVKEKEGRNRAVLQTFVEFGAKESILYDAKPHIGTDVLSGVVKRIREEVIALGGTVRFESQVTDLGIENGRLTYIVINNTERLFCKRLVLAIGHSARDTLRMLEEKEIPMEAKAFAVGFRVEHLQKLINLSQYGTEDAGEIGAAAYKLTAKAGNGRGVYSFCMCPGGYVVNASSQPGRLAVNGMSYSGRSGKNANSAIIVSVTPDDYPGGGPLAGVRFQEELEERAYLAGNGRIPVQRYGEFRAAVRGGAAERQMQESELNPCCKGAYEYADLSGILPAECSTAFVDGMEQFGRMIRGFNNQDTLLLGVESRTSSPVRMMRDDSLQSAVRGIYPCGEGAGYAGGITSAAMDGLRAAEKIREEILQSI